MILEVIISVGAELVDFIDYFLIASNIGITICANMFAIIMFHELLIASTGTGIRNCFLACKTILNEQEQSCILTLLFTMYWIVQACNVVIILSVEKVMFGVFHFSEKYYAQFYFIHAVFEVFGQGLTVFLAEINSARNKEKYNIINQFFVHLLILMIDELFSLIIETGTYSERIIFLIFGITRCSLLAVINLPYIVFVFHGVRTSPIRFHIQLLKIFSRKDIKNTVCDFFRYWGVEFINRSTTFLFMLEFYQMYDSSTFVQGSSMFLFEVFVRMINLLNINNYSALDECTGKLHILRETQDYEGILREYFVIVRKAIIIQGLSSLLEISVSYICLGLISILLPEGWNMTRIVHSTLLNNYFFLTFACYICNSYYYFGIAFFEYLELYFPIFIVLISQLVYSISVIHIAMELYELPNPIIELGIMEIIKTLGGVFMSLLIKKLFIKAIIDEEQRIQNDGKNNLGVSSSEIYTQMGYLEDNNCSKLLPVSIIASEEEESQNNDKINE